MHSLITYQKSHGYESDQDHMKKLSIGVKTSGIDLLSTYYHMSQTITEKYTLTR